MRFRLVACALLTLLIAAPAAAQFAAPMVYNEGPGIKLSDRFVFHPGVAVEGRYDSNPTYQEFNPIDAGYLRVLAHLDLATLPPQRLTDGNGKKYEPKVAFRLKGATSFRKYFSDNPAVTTQDAIEVDAGMLLALFPQGVFGATVQDEYARTVVAPNEEVNLALPRDTNRVGLKFRFTPGGGLLDFNLGYSFLVDVFEEDIFAFANRMVHEVAFNAKWRLLPKTAITLDISEQVINYYNRLEGHVIAGMPNNDSYPLRIYLGLAGLITPKLSTVLKVGYGNSFHTDFDSYNMVLGRAEVGYQFTPFARLRAGYEHGFEDAMFANFFAQDMVYLAYNQQFLQRFMLHSQVKYAYRNYGGFPPGGVDVGGVLVDELTHHLVGIDAGIDYQIKDWIYVGVGYDLQLKSVIEGPKVPEVIFANDYTKHQVFGKVGVSY